MVLTGPAPARLVWNFTLTTASPTFMVQVFQTGTYVLTGANPGYYDLAPVNVVVNVLLAIQPGDPGFNNSLVQVFPTFVRKWFEVTINTTLCGCLHPDDPVSVTFTEEPSTTFGSFGNPTVHPVEGSRPPTTLTTGADSQIRGLLPQRRDSFPNAFSRVISGTKILTQDGGFFQQRVDPNTGLPVCTMTPVNFIGAIGATGDLNYWCYPSLCRDLIPLKLYATFMGNIVYAGTTVELDVAVHGAGPFAGFPNPVGFDSTSGYFGHFPGSVAQQCQTMRLSRSLISGSSCAQLPRWLVTLRWFLATSQGSSSIPCDGGFRDVYAYAVEQYPLGGTGACPTNFTARTFNRFTNEITSDFWIQVTS